MDDYFRQFQQRYQQLRAMRDAGQLHPQQFMVEVQKLRWQDRQGIWWMIDPNGTLLRYDGQRWFPVQLPQASAPPGPTPPPMMPPPVRPAPSPQSVPPPVPAPNIAPQVVVPPQSAPQKRSFLQASSPILAIIPALLCGSLWFLYTFIGVFKYEGVEGIDFLTPLIVGGLPVLFWVLKKPLDQLLLPLRPIIQSMPRPLRMGICLAIPVFLGCGCSTFSPEGYLALSVSAFVSVITAALLLRY